MKSCGKKTREKKITIVHLEVVSPASLNADQSGKPITSITLMGGTPVNTEKKQKYQNANAIIKGLDVKKGNGRGEVEALE